MDSHTLSLITIPLPQPADWTVPVSLFVAYGVGVFILALAGLSASGQRGPRMVLRAAGGALFLSHWLLVVPWDGRRPNITASGLTLPALRIVAATDASASRSGR